MTNTVQMTETAQAVQASIRPSVYQLELAKSLLERHELSTNTVDTAIMLVEQIEQTVIELSNKDLDDYNTLFDQAEKLENSVIRLEGEVAQLKTELEDAQTAREVVEGEKGTLNIDLKLKIAELRAVREDLKVLNELQPERLKKRNVELKKENKQKTDLLNEQRLKIRDLTKSVAELKNKNTQAVNANLDQADRIIKLQRMVERTDGNRAERYYKGGNDAPESLEFYLHTYNWGLVSKKGQNASSILLDDLDWHLILRTNWGVDALIRYTHWLSPIIPEANIFPLSKHISDEIIIALCDFISDEVERTHPHLLRRKEWAEGVSLLDVEGIAERSLDSLLEAGFKTLYDVMKSVDGSIEAKCKGIGEKAEREVRWACQKLADKWKDEPEEDQLMVDGVEAA